MCQKVCFIDAKKKNKRVYTPFKEVQGQCVGVDKT
jgi:hypothetical protein